jgi:hypothetical protein
MSCSDDLSTDNLTRTTRISDVSSREVSLRRKKLSQPELPVVQLTVSMDYTFEPRGFAMLHHIIDVDLVIFIASNDYFNGHPPIPNMYPVYWITIST